MKHLRKISVILLVIIVVTIVVPLDVSAATLNITSQGAIVIDFDTGTVLFGHREETRRAPASMLKMLTAYVIYDAIKAGEISFDTVTKISQGVSRFSYDREFANVRLQPGQEVTIRELLDVSILISANAATVALAEALSNTEQAFVGRMQAKLIELNIGGRVVDCYGGSPDNSMSPFGFAFLMRNLLIEHPEILELTSKRTTVFDGTTYRNTNALLTDYSGADGLKTGYTDAAGHCLASSAERDGRRLIAVTMGSATGKRFDDSIVLLNHGFEVAKTALLPLEPALESGFVFPSGANLIIDGVTRPLSAFNIDGLHYFKLRDIAYLLSGTNKQFSVGFDDESKAISLTGGEFYIPDGSEAQLLEERAYEYITAFSDVYWNNVQYEFEAYYIEGNNYFMLKEIAPLLDVRIDWINETKTMIISS